MAARCAARTRGYYYLGRLVAGFPRTCAAARECHAIEEGALGAPDSRILRSRPDQGPVGRFVQVVKAHEEVRRGASRPLVLDAIRDSFIRHDAISRAPYN